MLAAAAASPPLARLLPAPVANNGTIRGRIQYVGTCASVQEAQVGGGGGVPLRDAPCAAGRRTCSCARGTLAV